MHWAGQVTLVRRWYLPHLERLHDWLHQQHHMAVLRVSYNELLAQPQTQAERVSRFLGGKAVVEAMVRTVDPTLYRNRKDPVREAL